MVNWVRFLRVIALSATLGAIFSVIGFVIYAIANPAAKERDWFFIWLGITTLAFFYFKYDSKEQYENEKLTCRRCNQLASPITGTGNRYRCDKCGRQFAAARHSF